MAVVFLLGITGTDQIACNIPSATPSQSQGDGVVTIPGVTQASQAVESAGAMKFRLSGDELPRLQTAPL